VVKTIRTVDEERRIVQVTTLGERWYSKPCSDPETGNDEIVFRPSVTFICDYYPKGPGFMKWVKQNGDQSDDIARLAADRGYKVHLAVAVLNQGGSVKGISGGDHVADRFLNPTTGQEEELTPDEYNAVLSYRDWWFEEGEKCFKILGSEYVTWPDPENLSEQTGYPEVAFAYAGTVDLRVEQLVERAELIAAGYKKWIGEKGSTGIIDMKTSKDVWPSHQMQGAAYAVSESADWAATLHLNYTKNKYKLFKMFPIDVKHWFRLFMSTKNIWGQENEELEPKQRDYPFDVSLKRKVGK
jgi:hypothetical protein